MEGRVAVLGVGELVWISDLGARLLAEYEWSILMKTGTTSEGTLQLTGKTIKIAGEGKDLSILESTQRSSLLSMSSGTVSFEDVDSLNTRRCRAQIRRNRSSADHSCPF
ncbi:hypothetical protein BLNAU_23245 [Blattamonas nauphoetae]|uniref:Uncharacterized protein n=1 Tax=Blattamonas nauphoetae TaxID=2049346 RepID=A0ABQ9WQS5_9EUKA|nr:hypothetical protein BLNAU_23245 [Blattamonas nauphoetae]